MVWSRFSGESSPLVFIDKTFTKNTKTPIIASLKTQVISFEEVAR